MWLANSILSCAEWVREVCNVGLPCDFPIKSAGWNSCIDVGIRMLMCSWKLCCVPDFGNFYSWKHNLGVAMHAKAVFCQLNGTVLVCTGQCLLWQLPVVFSEQSSKPQQTQLEASALATGIHLADVTLQPGATIQFDFDLQLASGLHGNEEAPNSWKLAGGGEDFFLTISLCFLFFT